MSAFKNDGRFPEDSTVLTPFPLTPEQTAAGRDAWEWVPGTILAQVGPDEWDVILDGRGDLAKPDPDEPGAYDYPTCFRGSSELRAVSTDEWEKQRVRRDENEGEQA